MLDRDSLAYLSIGSHVCTYFLHLSSLPRISPANFSFTLFSCSLAAGGAMSNETFNDLAMWGDEGSSSRRY